MAGYSKYYLHRMFTSLVKFSFYYVRYSEEVNKKGLNQIEDTNSLKVLGKSGGEDDVFINGTRFIDNKGRRKYSK